MIAQGWISTPDGPRIQMLVVKPAENGTSGWTVWTGSYAPGQSPSDIKEWKQYATAFSLLTLLQHEVLTIMGGWVEQNPSCEIKNALAELQRTMAACCAQGSP